MMIALLILALLADAPQIPKKCAALRVDQQKATAELMAAQEETARRVRELTDCQDARVLSVLCVPQISQLHDANEALARALDAAKIADAKLFLCMDEAKYH